MALTHKSINIRDEVWRQLRINAELSRVPVRDYLTFIILNSKPVLGEDHTAKQQLSSIGRENSLARLSPPYPSNLELAETTTIAS